MHKNPRYEIGLSQKQKVENSSGIALFIPVGWSSGGGGGNLTNMKRENNEGVDAGLVEKWRPRGRPSSLENGEEGAAPGGCGDPGLKHVGGQDLRRGPGGPGPGSEGGDGQHHSRICPGR
jgi:hypothetical protein